MGSVVFKSKMKNYQSIVESSTRYRNLFRPGQPRVLRFYDNAEFVKQATAEIDSQFEVGSVDAGNLAVVTGRGNVFYTAAFKVGGGKGGDATAVAEGEPRRRLRLGIRPSLRIELIKVFLLENLTKLDPKRLESGRIGSDLLDRILTKCAKVVQGYANAAYSREYYSRLRVSSNSTSSSTTAGVLGNGFDADVGIRGNLVETFFVSVWKCRAAVGKIGNKLAEPVISGYEAQAVRRGKAFVEVPGGSRCDLGSDIPVRPSPPELREKFRGVFEVRVRVGWISQEACDAAADYCSVFVLQVVVKAEFAAYVEASAGSSGGESPKGKMLPF